MLCDSDNAALIIIVLLYRAHLEEKIGTWGRKKKTVLRPKGSAIRDPKAMNQAMQLGALVQTIIKFEEARNKRMAAVVSLKILKKATFETARRRNQGSNSLDSA
ncbi:hypothetical protein ACFX2G_034895 [Malus domestica]